MVKWGQEHYYLFMVLIYFLCVMKQRNLCAYHFTCSRRKWEEINLLQWSDHISLFCNNEQWPMTPMCWSVCLASLFWKFYLTRYVIRWQNETREEPHPDIQNNYALVENVWNSHWLLGSVIEQILQNWTWLENYCLFLWNHSWNQPISEQNALEHVSFFMSEAYVGKLPHKNQKVTNFKQLWQTEWELIMHYTWLVKPSYISSANIYRMACISRSQTQDTNGSTLTSFCWSFSLLSLIE